MISFVIIFTKNLTDYITPVLIGWLISFSSVLIGSYIITRAFKNAGKGFINVVLMSMVVRMIAVVTLIFIVIYFFKVEKFSLAVTFFFFYLLFLILEINYLSANKNKNSDYK